MPRSYRPTVEDLVEVRDLNVVSIDPMEREGEQSDMEEYSALRRLDSEDPELLTEGEREKLSQYNQMYGNFTAEGANDASNHWANLAEFMEEDDLKSLGQDVLEWVRDDESSRSEWFEMEKKGIRALGVTPNIEGGADFEGASRVVHPSLAEACVRFAATAMDSLWPRGGPVRAVPLGSVTPEKIAKGYRVQNWMNYQYTRAMEGRISSTYIIQDAYESMDQALHRLPLSGSVFTKLWVDPVHGVRRRMVEPADFIVPYNATSLVTASRYTERLRLIPAEVKKLQRSGYYRDVELSGPTSGTSDIDSFRTTVTDEIDDAEGREEQMFDDEHDSVHVFYECTCEVMLEDIDGEDGEGVPRQYVITVDSDTQKVLSIYRNWRPDDPNGTRILWYRHDRFTPGLGFYGYGFHHWVSGLTTTATGALRALLDAAMLSNLQGGFRSKEAGIRSGMTPLKPGEWREIDASVEDLSRAFFRVPYSEPSSVLFNLMIHTEELFQRFAGTVDAMVGEGTQNTPVGTILARIEQGSKVLTSVQKRLHVAQRGEFNLLYWINSHLLPDEEYPYEVAGEDRSVMRSDFDGSVELQLSSDPGLISNAQRYFISKESLDLAGTAPQFYDMRALHTRAQMILGVENLQEIMPPPQDPRRLDPVTENALATQGRAVKAFLEQDHQAHNAVHMQFLLSLPKDMQDKVGGPLQAHIAEHYAQGYLVQMSQMTGIQFTGEEQELPPEQEAQIAQAVAQAVAQMQPPQIDEMAAEQQRKDAEVQARIDRQNRAAEATIKREDTKAAADIRRKDIGAVME